MPIDLKKAARWMKRELAELESYAARERSFSENERHALAEYSAGKAPIGHATVGLRCLAGYRSVLGCLQVLHGDERGFAEIDLACLYKYWSTRILVRAYELDTDGDKLARVLMETVAPCWMHATAIGAGHVRNWLDGLIAKIHAGDQSVRGKDMNPLCTLMANFVLQLRASRHQAGVRLTLLWRLAVGHIIPD